MSSFISTFPNQLEEHCYVVYDQNKCNFYSLFIFTIINPSQIISSILSQIHRFGSLKLVLVTNVPFTAESICVKTIERQNNVRKTLILDINSVPFSEALGFIPEVTKFFVQFRCSQMNLRKARAIFNVEYLQASDIVRESCKMVSISVWFR